MHTPTSSGSLASNLTPIKRATTDPDMLPAAWKKKVPKPWEQLSAPWGICYVCILNYTADLKSA